MEQTRNSRNKRRLIVGMTGASGAILGIEVLKTLARLPDWETYLILSKGAEETIRQETDYSVENVLSLADRTYSFQDIGAAVSSGTFRTNGMLIVPCSMKTAAGIICGYSDNLILRAADVVLKERRKLVLVAREAPLSSIHLRNLLALSEAGAVVLPPMVSYYSKPRSIAELNLQIVGKILDQFEIETEGFFRWENKDLLDGQMCKG
jgi:4-hydroxy-3-polyprenylbenzoate decarboxylase